MNAKRFKNGNFNVRFDADDTGTSEQENAFVALLWGLERENTDFNMLGEEYCISNYDTAITLYNAYTGLVYMAIYGNIAKAITNGTTLKLYGHKPDADEQNMIEEEER